MFACGSLQVTTGAGPFTIGGLPFVPEVFGFFWTGIDADVDTVSATTSVRAGVGYALKAPGGGGAKVRATGWYVEDNAPDMLAETVITATSCVVTVSSAGAVDGRLSVASWDSQGITLQVDVALPVNFRLGWWALGKDHPQDRLEYDVLDFNEPGATGSQDYTGLSFTPEAAILVCSHASVVDTPTDGGGVSLGMVCGNYNGLVAVISRGNAVATSLTRTYTQNNSGEVVGMLSAVLGSPTARASFTQFLPTGFRLNWTERAVTRRCFALCLAGPQMALRPYLGRTDTTTPIASPESPAFLPQGGVVLSGGFPASASDNADNDAIFSMGVFRSATDRFALGYADDNFRGTSVVTVAAEFDEVAVILNAAGESIDGLLDVYDYPAKDVRFIMDDAEPTANTVYLALLFGAYADMVTWLPGGMTAGASLPSVVPSGMSN